MGTDQGASAKADRAATPSEPSQSSVVSGVAGIPCAFTPGPWAISHQGGSIAAHPTVTLANGEKRWTTTRICSFPSSGNIEANALLIAAAPDLYEALVQAAQHINELRDEWSVRDTTNDAPPDYIAKALAKARGQ